MRVFAKDLEVRGFFIFKNASYDSLESVCEVVVVGECHSIIFIELILHV